MKLVIVLSIFFGLNAHAGGEILRGASGYAKLMFYDEAVKACPKGTHLPTVRELAKEMEAYGAKGILELKQVDPNKVPFEYYKVSAVNRDGRRDVFYYNRVDYKGPIEDLESHWFWSSSVDSNDSKFAFGFGSEYGDIGLRNRVTRDSDGRNVVLCVPNR